MPQMNRDFRSEGERIRSSFPLLNNHPDLAYLDNAATTQKPQCVLDAVTDYYTQANSNPLRGLYDLSVAATDCYEEARTLVQDFIHAKAPEEIIFTRNASESLNLAAVCAGRAFLSEGDEILISILEHHSNLLPWQQAARRMGAVLRFVECDETGTISEERFRAALTPKTRLVAMTQVSNVLGICNDIRLFASIAHEAGALFVCDGAQSVPHMPVDVQALDVDFLAFSGHKMLAPMGIGVLYGKKEFLEKMPPFLFGGEMIETVSREGATYAPLPHKFEAGTVNVGGAAGLAAAIRYYREIGFETIVRREQALGAMAFRLLKEMPHVHLLGAEDPEQHNGIFTFTVEGVHPHDVAAILNEDLVAVRAGHHCAQPLMKHLHTLSTTRASLAFYNTEEDVLRLAESLRHVRERMGLPE